MAASRLFGCLSVLIFLLILSPAYLTYVDYDISSDRVCSRLGKRELSISLTRPLLVREGGRLLGNWPGTHSFQCRWEVEAKGRGLGVVAVIQKLKFRSYDECLDYIKFKEDGSSESTLHICGSILFGIPVDRDLQFLVTPPSRLPQLRPTMQSTTLTLFVNIFKGPPNPWKSVASHGAAVDPRGELKTYIYVANKALKSDDSLDLVVAYSGFQECDGARVPSTLFHCGYGLCISRLLVNDGVINCPFGDCIDEGSCNEAKVSNATARILGSSVMVRELSGVPPGIAATSSVFAIAIMITIGACICFILRKNRERRQEQPAGGVSVYPGQGGSGDYMGVPMSAVGHPADSNGDPLVPKPTIPGMPVGGPGGQPPSQSFQQGGSGPPIGFTVPGGPPGTAYPSSVGTPYPYPGSGTPYPLQPPPSTAAQGTAMPSAPSQELPPPYSSLFPDH